MPTPKPCANPACERQFRPAHKEQRYCSIECHRVVRYGPRGPEIRRCEHCTDVFTIGRRKGKRFCSARCVALWREFRARVRRAKLPPPPPRRRKPGRIEWSIGGMHLGRGMAPTPRPAPAPPKDPWRELLTRVGYARLSDD